MIEKIKALFNRARKGGRRVAFGLSLGIGIAAAPPEVCHADPPTGTYVVPRDTTVFSQLVTNGGPAYTFAITNFLNYSGFHRLGLWATLSATNAAGQANTNWSLTLWPAIGGGSGYANVIGTNFVIASTPWFTESYLTGPNLFGITNQTWATNLDSSVVDTVQVLCGKLTLTGSNNVPFFFQIDQRVTP
jgi:hypothetical protein